MAHLLPNYPNRSILKSPHNESISLYRCTSIKHGAIGLIDCGRTGKDAGLNEIVGGKTRPFERKRGLMVQCCSSSTSSAKEMGLVGKVELDENHGDEKEQSEYLASEYGWKVRRLVEEEDEMRKAAQVQAEAFHIPVPLFNDLIFQFFQAEVLSGLLYKLRNSPPDRYACLVSEPSNDDSESPKEVVGVVDVTVLRDKGVLDHLQGAEEYLYVSGIAVLDKFRRRKVATVLLKACDTLSILWGFDYLVLRAYEDDWGARKLYANAGYRVVSADSPWMTTWIGRKRRVLMIKKSNLPRLVLKPGIRQLC